jgi:ribosome biogenesis GTPase
LTDLGLDRGLAELTSCGSGQSLARVTAVDRGRYVVRNEEGEVPAELTGKFLYAAASSVDMPCVGDWVCVQYHDAESHATIHDLVPRRSFLRRKSPGKNIDFQMIAANIDVAFIVQSCHFDFNVRRLERYAHYRSYLKLKAGSEFNEMSYVDKRKKDKAFGKVVKSVLKDRRK